MRVQSGKLLRVNQMFKHVLADAYVNMGALRYTILYAPAVLNTDALGAAELVWSV
ncbi:MAG: hypothetical protein ACRYG8_36860 [Janthinobacterium lividum]